MTVDEVFLLTAINTMSELVARRKHSIDRCAVIAVRAGTALASVLVAKQGAQDGRQGDEAGASEPDSEGGAPASAGGQDR